MLLLALGSIEYLNVLFPEKSSKEINLVFYSVNFINTIFTNVRLGLISAEFLSKICASLINSITYCGELISFFTIDVYPSLGIVD